MNCQKVSIQFCFLKGEFGYCLTNAIENISKYSLKKGYIYFQKNNKKAM